MSEKISIQKKLFDKIIKQHPKRAEAVDAIQDILSIGRDATYRRLRGETLLSPEEMRDLALKYNISLDELAFQDADIVFVSYNVFETDTQNFLEFTTNLNKMLKQVSALPDVEIFHASDEMPIFQLMRFPELFAFKLYVWGVNTWQFGHLQNTPFKTNLVSPDVLNVAKENVFENPEDALLLCDQLMELFKHLRTVAESGIKFPMNQTSKNGKGNFKLFYNEMTSTGNTFLVKSSQSKFLVTAFCSPNFFRSNDERLCNYAEDWLQNIISRSVPMSGAGARSRNRYFNRLEKKIINIRNRVKMIIDGDIEI